MRQQGIDNIEHGVVARPRLLGELAATLKTTERWLLWGEGPETLVHKTADFTSVPLLSWSAVGALADVESQIPVEGVPLLACADLGGGEFFALRTQDDSMDRLSPKGSIIIVNRADRALVPDRPFVVKLRDEVAYRLWQPDPARLEPASINPLRKPQFIKRKRDVVVIGRVRRTTLDFDG